MSKRSNVDTSCPPAKRPRIDPNAGSSCKLEIRPVVLACDISKACPVTLIFSEPVESITLSVLQKNGVVAIDTPGLELKFDLSKLLRDPPFSLEAQQGEHRLSIAATTLVGVEATYSFPLALHQGHSKKKGMLRHFVSAVKETIVTLRQKLQSPNKVRPLLMEALKHYLQLAFERSQGKLSWENLNLSGLEALLENIPDGFEELVAKLFVAVLIFYKTYVSGRSFGECAKTWFEKGMIGILTEEEVWKSQQQHGVAIQIIAEPERCLLLTFANMEPITCPYIATNFGEIKRLVNQQHILIKANLTLKSQLEEWHKFYSTLSAPPEPTCSGDEGLALSQSPSSPLSPFSLLESSHHEGESFVPPSFQSSSPTSSSDLFDDNLMDQVDMFLDLSNQ